MNLKLYVWRQKNKNDSGRMEQYTAQDISPDCSFLEMLDVLNEKILKEGGSPVEYDHDCREGICGTCSLVVNGRLLNALDPDLSAFRDAGGKYLMWHGWQDPLVLPDHSVHYYESVLEEMGGHQEVDPFFRLFMIPGKGHCWEMPSALPDRFDPITMLERWVENGEAPEFLAVRALDPEETVIPASVICPYPGRPVYLDNEDPASGNFCDIQGQSEVPD